MNREQAQAILKNIDLIRHFAEGGDIGHRLHDYKGRLVCINPARGILLSNIVTMGKYYVKLKPKLVWDKNLGTYIRKERCWMERVRESEVLPLQIESPLAMEAKP